MISIIRKFAAELSFRERRTTTSLVYIDFIIALILEILALTNLIILAETNNILQLNSTLLFFLHIIRLDFVYKIIPVPTILTLNFLIFTYFLCCRNRSQYIGLSIKILPVACAVCLMQIQAYICQQIQQIQAIISQYSITIFIISLIWIGKLLVIPENYMNKHCKLTKFPDVLRTNIFILQILGLIFQINIEYFILLTLILEIMSLIVSLFSFEFICRDFEYLYFLGRCLRITIIFFYLLQVESILPKNILILQFIPYVCFLFFITTDLYKIIFQKKYHHLLKKNNLTPIQIIVLYNHLLEQKNSDSLKSSFIFKFPSNNLIWNIIIKRFFHNQKIFKQLKQSQQISIKTKLCKKTQKNNQEPLALSFDNENILVWLEKQQQQLKSELLNIYICFTYLSQQKYLKSIQYLLKARKFGNHDKDKDQSTTFQLIYYQIENFKYICNQFDRNGDQQKSINCYLLNRQQHSFLPRNHINCISMQLQFEQLIKKIEQFFNTTNTLFLSLNDNFSSNIHSNKIKTLLFSKIKQKRHIETLIQNICSQGFYNKKFVFIYYVYLNICCSQSYIVFQKLLPLLEIKNDNNDQCLQKKSSENDMMVMVSLEDKHIGMIQHANMIMKSFFSLKDNKIQSMTESIQKIIPKVIAAQHNQLMLKFKKTGVSNFIGKRNQLVVIQNHQKPYEAIIDIKMFVSLHGNISLTSRINIIREQTNIILFDSMGQIFENTLGLSKKDTNLKRKDSLRNSNFFTLIDLDIITKVQTTLPRVFISYFQNRLGRIKIQSLKIKDSHIKICKIKFLNKISQTIQRITTDQNTCSFKSQSKKSDLKNFSKQMKLLDLQFKIFNMKFTRNPEHINFILVFLILLIILLIIIDYSFNYIQYQIISTRSLTTFYTNILNGFRTRFFFMNNRYLLLHAINNNIISDAIASIYNISSLQQYIRNTTLPYLTNFDGLDSMIYDPSYEIPSSYLNKFSDALIDFDLPYEFKISWVSMLKSFYHQTPFESSQFFEAIWENYTLPFNSYLSNNFFSQINDNIYNPIIKNDIAEANLTGNNIKGLIYLMGILILLLIIIIFLIMNKIHMQTEKCISLISEIDNSSWKIQSKKIRLCLKELNKAIIINYQIDYEFQSIKYYLQDGKLLTMQHGEIFFQHQQQNDVKKNNRNLKKQINTKNIQECKRKFTSSNLIKTHLDYILIIIFFSLPLFAMFLRSFNISTFNYNTIIFFYDYMNSISNFRISSSIMLNIAIAQLVLPTLPKINNIEVDLMIPILKSHLLNRTYEDVLKNSLPWTLVSDYLYESNCNSTDNLCKKLISGSLNENTPQAILQFSKLNFILYYNYNNMTNSSQSQKNLLCQLWITLQQYLRPIILQIQTNGLDLTNSKLSQIQNEITLIFNKVINPSIIFLLLISYWVIYRMLTELHDIKKQILMSDKVGHLINKAKFWSYLIKLK